MAPGKWKMDVDRMLEQIDENTIVVVPTFGVTYTGAYELPAEVAMPWMIMKTRPASALTSM